MLLQTSPSQKGRFRDEQILQMLTFKVRVASQEQIGESLWSDSTDPVARASSRLAKFVRRGLLEQDSVNAHPLLPLAAPVICWKPGTPDPDYEAVAYQFESRWTQPFRTVTVYVATIKAANQRGGFGGSVKQRHHVTHDLHVTQLYLRLLKCHPALAEGWVGEETRKAEGLELYEKLPDAVIFDRQGKPRLAVEFGGRYPPEHIAEFHQHCKGRELPYHMW